MRRFLRGTRAAATAVAGVAVTVMTVGATAFITDSAWITDQRDLLKSASDAAGIAATLEMSRQLDLQPNISDADLAALLEPIARRYILLNLKHMDADRYRRAEQTLTVQVVPNRIGRTVDVAAEAELGGTFMSRLLPFMAQGGVAERLRAETKAETFTNPVEVVLAIDFSSSMKNAVDSNRRPPWWSGQPTRMEVVKLAAANLVAVLAPNAEDRIAIGLVPWSQAVGLDEQARDRWVRNGWARYPTQRVYGVPYHCLPGGACEDPPPVTQAVAASAPEAWLGCLDEHRMGSVGTLASLPTADEEWLWPPARSAFAQHYFAAHHSFAYECIATPPSDMQHQYCYGPSTNHQVFGDFASQYPCADSLGPKPPPPIQPLSNDPDRINQAIDALEPVGAGTYSTIGVLWAQRLLEHSWKDVWGGTTHPADVQDRNNVGLRKAIVLLTDGVDNYCGLWDPACDNRDIGIPLQAACDAAKASGSEIFVIAGMAPTYIPQALEDRLRACSSESDNPDGTYVFVDNATPEALISAFAEIADQLRTVRRVY